MIVEEYAVFRGASLWVNLYHYLFLILKAMKRNM